MHPQRQGLGPGSDYLNFKKTLKSENYFFKTKNITECWRRNLVRYNVSIKTREPWIKIIFWQLTAKTIFLNKLFVEFSREAQKRPQADYPGERFNFQNLLIPPNGGQRNTPSQISFQIFDRSRSSSFNVRFCYVLVTTSSVTRLILHYLMA